MKAIAGCFVFIVTTAGVILFGRALYGGNDTAFLVLGIFLGQGTFLLYKAADIIKTRASLPRPQSPPVIHSYNSVPRLPNYEDD